MVEEFQGPFTDPWSEERRAWEATGGNAQQRLTWAMQRRQSWRRAPSHCRRREGEGGRMSAGASPSRPLRLSQRGQALEVPTRPPPGNARSTPPTAWAPPPPCPSLPPPPPCCHPGFTALGLLAAGPGWTPRRESLLCIAVSIEYRHSHQLSRPIRPNRATLRANRHGRQLRASHHVRQRSVHHDERE